MAGASRAAQRLRAAPRGLAGRGPFVLLLASYPIALLIVLAKWRSPDHAVDRAAGPLMLGYALVASALAVRAASRPDLDRRARRGWRFMAAAFAILVASCVAFAATDPHAFPTVGDGVRLIFVPVLLAGLLTLPAPARTPEEAAKTGLDIGIVVAGGAMVLWYLVLGAVVVGHAGALATLAAGSYPVGDLALMYGITKVLFRATAPTRRPPVLVLAAGVLAFIAGDVYLGYQRTHAAGADYAGWQFLCWLTAHFLLAVAAALQCRHVEGGTDTDAAQPWIRPVPRLPYAAVAIGYVLLVVAASGLPLYPYGGMVIGAVAITSLVVARQVVALRENQRLAVTDSLTGLANRALLRQEVQRALTRARRTNELIAVLLIDLDGFKQVNDTLGHEAGDALLVAFADLLRRNVRGSDCVARLGGDEFAILMSGADPAGNAPTVADRLAEASTLPVMVAGHALRPNASIGVAVSGPDSTVAELLHRADTEMYRIKRAHADARRHLRRTQALDADTRTTLVTSPAH